MDALKLLMPGRASRLTERIKRHGGTSTGNKSSHTLQELNMPSPSGNYSTTKQARRDNGTCQKRSLKKPSVERRAEKFCSRSSSKHHSCIPATEARDRGSSPTRVEEEAKSHRCLHNAEKRLTASVKRREVLTCASAPVEPAAASVVRKRRGTNGEQSPRESSSTSIAATKADRWW